MTNHHLLGVAMSGAWGLSKQTITISFLCCVVEEADWSWSKAVQRSTLKQEQYCKEERTIKEDIRVGIVLKAHHRASRMFGKEVRKCSWYSFLSLKIPDIFFGFVLRYASISIYGTSICLIELSLIYCELSLGWPQPSWSVEAYKSAPVHTPFLIDCEIHLSSQHLKQSQSPCWKRSCILTIHGVSSETYNSITIITMKVKEGFHWV